LEKFSASTTDGNPFVWFSVSIWADFFVLFAEFYFYFLRV
jgi:hypothetical protein